MHEQLAEVIALGSHELLAMQQDSGKFKYRTGKNISLPERKYNILRHCGSVFSLIECKGFLEDSKKNAVINSLHWVEKDHLRPFRTETGWILAVASDDFLRRKYSTFKLGGTALYIVAAVRAREEGFLTFEDDFLARAGRFLLLMQKNDGGFHSKLSRISGEFNKNFESLYYPGEAALAFISLARIMPEGPWFDAASMALAFLAKKREGQTSVEPDHWALIATSEYFKLPPSQADNRRPLIESHAIQLVQSMLKEYRDNAVHGCFTGDGRTCPTSTRLEGLTAIYPIISETVTDEQRAEVKSVIFEAMHFLIKSQYKQGQRAGGFPRTSSEWLRYTGTAPDRRADEVRIDYIQHAICGLKGVMDTFA